MGARSERFDFVVVGAGTVGLATARAMLARGPPRLRDARSVFGSRRSS